jgi:Rieske Fe-S protein
MVVAASVGAACGDGESTEPLGAGGAGGVGGAGGMGGGLPEGYQALGNVSGIPEGALLEAPGFDLFVGRDQGGVYAMTSRCTHQGCNMLANDGIVAPGVIRCGCHNSEFDANGAAIMGPAQAPLQHFAVIVDEAGTIGVNTDEPVGPDERAAVG